jgi:rare lipoprotein A
MIKYIYIKIAFLLFYGIIFVKPEVYGQQDQKNDQTTTESKATSRILYGQASFYADKFEGRKTATGEIFRHSKLTAACNVLPLGTWIKVTNLRNGKWIVVRTNDRLHVKTKRIVDLTRTGAQKLGYSKSGLTRVKIEVLKHKPS